MGKKNMKGTSQTEPDLFGEEEDLSQYRNGRDELNIAEFPLAMLSKRRDPNIKTLEFEDTTWDKGAGKRVTRKLIVTASDKWGLPTPTDDDVVLALVQLARMQNFNSIKVPFSLYQIIQLLGWSHKASNYQLVRQSLSRWVSVTMKYENAWWNAKTKEWMDEEFHIIDRVTTSRDEKGKKNSQFQWGSVIYESLQNGNVKELDWQAVTGLSSPIAKRLYRLLDKRFHWGKPVSFDVKALAIHKLGLSKNYTSIGTLKQKLSRGIAELEDIGFIRKVPAKDRYRKLGVGQWEVMFEKAHPVDETLPLLEDTPQEVGAVEALLIDFGVSVTQARRLVVSQPEVLIRAKIDILKYKIATEDAPTNPAGWLVRAINEDWAPPADFKSEAERAAEDKAAEDRAEARKQRMAELEAKAQEDKRAVDAAEHARRETIDGYLNGLSATDRQALIETAIAAVPDGLGFKNRQGPAGDAFRQSAIDEHVLTLLSAG
ncbi:MAG: replication initiator protein A [Verrucomicrobiota bacterium]